MKSGSVACLTIVIAIAASFGPIAGTQTKAASPLQEEVESAGILQLPTSKALVRKASDVLVQLRSATQGAGLSYVAPDYFIPTTARIQQDIPGTYEMVGPTVNFGSEVHNFDFRKTDGHLARYQNSTIINVLMDGPTSKLYEKQEASWTKEKAINVAEKFRDVLLDSHHVALGQPFAHYDHTSGEPGKDDKGKEIEKWHVGMWQVDWPRVDSQGHPFFGDHVSIQISEQYGLVGAGIFLFTPFSERTGSIISQERAISIAKSNVKLTPEGLSQAPENPDAAITKLNLKSAQLMITVINRKGAQGGPAAQLVWEIWFRPQLPYLHPGPTYNHDFAFWVDAYSGEIVGGDAMM